MDFLQDGETVSVRESKIEEDRIVGMLLDRRVGFLTSRNAGHVKPFKFEQVLEAHRDIRIIFHHQNGISCSPFTLDIRSLGLSVTGC